MSGGPCSVQGVGSCPGDCEGPGAISRRELNCWHSLRLGQGIRTFLWPRAELLAWESNIFISSGLPGQIEVLLGDVGVNNLGKHGHCCVPLTLGWVPRSTLSLCLSIWLPSAISSAAPSTGHTAVAALRQAGPCEGQPQAWAEAGCSPRAGGGLGCSLEAPELAPLPHADPTGQRAQGRDPASATLRWFLSSRPVRGRGGPQSTLSCTRRCPGPPTPAWPPQRPLHPGSQP